MREKRDYYYWEAKRQGYRSRAAFKLLQMNKEFRLIRKGDLVLDLGASPGGWSQVAAELGAFVV
jgi:23S rRNA (uridine2552-2'-O)-methyltransferase